GTNFSEIGVRHQFSGGGGAGDVDVTDDEARAAVLDVAKPLLEPGVERVSLARRRLDGRGMPAGEELRLQGRRRGREAPIRALGPERIAMRGERLDGRRGGLRPERGTEPLVRALMTVHERAHALVAGRRRL